MTETPSLHEARTRGPQLAAISNEMVRLRAKYCGRGPTKARTVVAGDTIVVRMLDPFTTAERTLIACGRESDVRRGRAILHDGLAEEFIAAIERLTGRGVVHYFSDVAVEANIALDVFLLERQSAPPEEPAA